MQFETKVLGGLPVTVEYMITGHWTISAVNKKECKKKPQWIINRLSDKGREALDAEIKANIASDKIYGNH